MSATAYPALPQPPRPQPGDTAQGYGLRVLSFVLETGVTATVPTRALELADHVYPIAIGAKDILSTAVDALSETRTRILACLEHRRVLAEEERSFEEAKSRLRQGHLGASGQEAKLEPRKPGPLSGGALALKPGDTVDVPF